MTYPRNLPRRYRKYWARPWLESARKSLGFRRWLKKNGLMTPHFTVEEYRSGDGRPMPRRLRKAARDHCFRLEKFRHAVGDRSMPILSGYRSPQHNAAVGGASQSQHMSGKATDFSRETVNRIGRERFFSTAEALFGDGGVGDYPAGSAHLDSRGYRARWRYY